MEDGNYKTTKKAWFKDRKGKIHNFFLCGSIHGLTGYNGLLTDEYNKFDVRQAFRKNHRNRNVILDIDLDFFTYRDDEDGAWAMNERHLETILSSEAFNFLWSSAEVVTIA